MKPTDIDPVSLAEQAKVIARTADTVADGLTELERTITTDNPWGADEPGTIFGMAYTAVAGHALEAYGSQVESLVYAAGGLIEMADRIAGADAGAAQGLTALRARTGG